MKKIYFKKGVFATLTLSLLTSSAQGGKYADIFTREIYDQSAVLLKTFNNEKEKDKELIEMLKEKKKEQLEKKCINKIKETIEYLKNECSNTEAKNFFKDAAAKMDKQTCKEALGTLLADFTRPFTFGAFDSLLKTYGHKPSYSSVLTPIYTKIIDLKIEIEDLYKNLENEPIKAIEEKYVLQKREMQDKKLIEEIEKGLIEVRKSDYITGMTYPFLEMSLQLPLRPKPLIDKANIDEELSDLLKRFEEHPNFKNYDMATREQIKEIIIQAAIDSITPDASNIPLKKPYYFYGDPSSGKTYASREIAIFLGLPYYEMTARSASEFIQMNVEGADRISPNPNPGWLARTLMETTHSDKESYKNAFLIINDLDRLLADAKSATTTLTFLLDFLDPQKSQFRNPYFRTNIDISRLNIIITANYKLDINDFYNALKTRMFKLIEFPKFSLSVIKEQLDNYLMQLKVQYHIPEEFIFEYIDCSIIAIKYKKNLSEDQMLPTIPEIFPHKAGNGNGNGAYAYHTGVIENENEKEKITLRELKSILCSTVLNLKIKLLEKGNKWFEDACVQGISKQEQEKLYKKAAFLGNKKAHRKLFPDLEDISSTPTNASPKSPENSSNTSTNNSTQDPSASSDTSSTHSGHSSNTSSHNSTQGNSTNKHNNFSEDKKIENLEHSLCLFSIGHDRNVRAAILNDEKNWNFVSMIGKDWQAHTLSNRYQDYHLFSDGSLPADLFSSISVTSFNETYRMIAVGKKKEWWCEYNKIWGASSTDGKNWMDVKEISPDCWEAGGGVSLCSFKKDLYLVHIGKNHGIWLSVSRDGKFEGPETNAFRINDLDWCAYDAISLTAFKEKLYLAYINKTGQICIISSPDGKEWTKPREILKSSNDIYHTADLSIGFTSFKDKLYLGYTGREYDCGKIIREQHVNRYKHNFLKMNKSSKMNSKDFLLGSKKGIWLTSSEDGEIWGESMSIMEQKTADCVNLTVFQENLCFAFQSEKRIWLSYSKDGQNWADPQDSNWDSDGQFCLTPLLKVSHK